MNKFTLEIFTRPKPGEGWDAAHVEVQHINNITDATLLYATKQRDNPGAMIILTSNDRRNRGD